MEITTYGCLPRSFEYECLAPSLNGLLDVSFHDPKSPSCGPNNFSDSGNCLMVNESFSEASVLVLKLVSVECALGEMFCQTTEHVGKDVAAYTDADLSARCRFLSAVSEFCVRSVLFWDRFTRSCTADSAASADPRRSRERRMRRLGQLRISPICWRQEDFDGKAEAI